MSSHSDPRETGRQGVRPVAGDAGRDPPAVRTEELSMRYRTEGGDELEVFRDVGISVGDGEFVSIIGPSGGGKSTLLEIMAGLRRPSAGRVLIYGREERAPSADKGVVFQKDAVFPWYTVEQNVLYGLKLKRLDGRYVKERAASFLDMVGLGPYRNYYPKELSGGMRKRLAIAMVFANDPRILFMDEPFGSLDYTTKIELQNELLNLWALNRKTILFVTHDLEEALFLSSRIHVLREKRIVKTFDVPYARPRGFELRNSGEFRGELANLWEYIR